MNGTSLSDINNKRMGYQFLKIKFWACRNVLFIFYFLLLVYFLVTKMQA